jgi:uncharacterized lipoprotein YbaY
MTVIGTVRDGKIVLPEGVALPDGAQIPIELPVAAEAAEPASELGRELLKFAGTIDGLPADLSINHDHYLYGAPKR